MLDAARRAAAAPSAARCPGLHPDRAPTIVAGVVMLIEALRAFGLDAVEVSEHDILRGAALERCTGAEVGMSRSARHRRQS